MTYSKRSAIVGALRELGGAATAGEVSVRVRRWSPRECAETLKKSGRAVVTGKHGADAVWVLVETHMEAPRAA
ncbi:MAG: hypothetical protein QOE90_936 [Thermoplasmata archaeon]|nr:hypothetical protein [Thermoplasmata archaeon]